MNLLGDDARRQAMVERDIAGRRVRDPAVLKAMGTVPREHFVPEDLRDLAYADMPLPIGDGQTISQPYIVAVMAEAAAIEPADRVLEVGTGSGYGAAVLSQLASTVVTIERFSKLAEAARRRLEELAYLNVTVVTGDGALGWPSSAPYDAIVVTAASPVTPPSLLEQLAEQGRLVIPVGRSDMYQRLTVLQRKEEGHSERVIAPVRFVPLVSGVR